MDLFGMDRKFSDLGDEEIDDFLDSEVFTPPPSNASLDLDSPMEDVWFDNFFDDPVLNDRMITDALQPNVQSEHSYSMTNGTTTAQDIIQMAIKSEPVDGDVDPDLLSRMDPVTLTPSQPEVTLPEIKPDPYITETEMATVTVTRTTSAPTSLVKQQPTIILASHNHSNTVTAMPVVKQERVVMPKVNIKVEPYDSQYLTSTGSSPEHITTYESPSLPPTPPSSHSSDSEGSLSPGRSTSCSPIRQTPLARHQSLRAAAQSTTLSSHSLFSGTIPTSGMLLLTEEERRTLISEGYPIPSKLPLTKQEEKNLKKIRRKIKNKISAQESRRKKKEYMETLEKRVESFSNENNDLRRKVDHLETNNRSLMSQLQKLQNLVNKVTRPIAPTTQTGTCLMVLVLCFALFLGSWTPVNIKIGYSSISSPPVPAQTAYTSLPSSPLRGGPGADAAAQAGAGSPMGPHLKEGVVVDAYSTPTKRSRVLLSIKEDECEEDMSYGPHAPLSYRDLILHWFRPVASHGVAGDQGEQVMQPPLPEVTRLDVESENNQTGEDGKQPRATPAAAAMAAAAAESRAMMRPDLAADLAPSVMGKRRLETVE